MDSLKSYHIRAVVTVATGWRVSYSAESGITHLLIEAVDEDEFDLRNRRL
jgi:hypothetical protein